TGAPGKHASTIRARTAAAASAARSARSVRQAVRGKPPLRVGRSPAVNSAHAALRHGEARLAHGQTLVPGDAGLIDPAQGGVGVVVADDVLAFFEAEALAVEVDPRLDALGGHDLIVAPGTLR